jgi:predicted TIM-barrel fold metal-dependent hydrolase
MSDPCCTHRSDPPRTRRLCLSGLCVAVALVAGGETAPATATDLPLFDAHLHYTGVDAAALPPAQIIAILDHAGVTRAVVSGMPASSVVQLHAAAPDRIIPFLTVYNAPNAKRDWMHDANLPVRVAELLDASGGIYRGIGELHIFAQDAASPVLMALADMAAERGLMLQIHGDAAVLDAVFARQPGLTVLWAHLGTEPRPEVIAPVLARHPNLYVDTSVRAGRFVDDAGVLQPPWRDFFVQHADRVLVGVDTFWTRRWKRFAEVADEIRGWLAQLPPDIAEQLARGNAERLFNRSSAVPQSFSSRLRNGSRCFQR